MTDIPPAVASLPSPAQAVKMLETFASIGATHFDVTFTHLTGEKRGFRCNRPLAEVKESMPPLVASSTRRQNNVIVRPRVEGATCIQLDDLDRQKGLRIAPAAFLMLETSPGNYQAWVAVKDAPLGLHSRLRKGIGADLNASGATRVAGTYNFKSKYEPGFPVVQVAARSKGRFATLQQLEQLDVLAAEVKYENTSGDPVRGFGRTSKWPSYGEVLDRAPRNEEGNPKRTSVDFTWCMMALSWGHSVEATAAKLMEQSGKAQENGDEYALKTSQRAVYAAAKRQQQKQPRP